MHASGAVDIQSHSATHALVPISPRVVDFLRPDFDTNPFGNVNVPLSVLDDPRQPERRLRLGAPVFESASRLAGRARFKEDPELVATLADYVEIHGGVEFFRTSGWRKRLLRAFAKWPEQRRGSYETIAEMEQWLWFELAESKQQLETRLAGKRVRHFCYPWFQGSSTADRLAAEVGYQAVHEGIFSRNRQHSGIPLRVPRIPAEYLLTLPRSGRSSFWSVWGQRLRHHVRRPRVAAL
jgi:hypothetical protein